MTGIHTWERGQVTIDFSQEVYEKLRDRYDDLTEFVAKMQFFNADLAKHKNLYNISAYPDHIQKGIHVLGKENWDFDAIATRNLALKCSQGKPFTEDLRKQFYRSIQISQDLAAKLNPTEKKLLQICPVYWHFQSRAPQDYFKQILLMQQINGVALGDTETGFSQEFRQVFGIPSLAEIETKSRFSLHLALDPSKPRQLLKIQTVYLFKKLAEKGIKIWSLNQKNILVEPDEETQQMRYIIIDPTEDFFPPISPAYNALTSKFI